MTARIRPLPDRAPRTAPQAESCAAVRLAGAEPMHGTAPEAATAWLLVEHPGPWPAKGIPAGVPDEVRRVWEAAGEAGIRRHWIRDTRRRRESPATVFVASTRPGAAWLERRVVSDLRELDGLDVAALGEERPPGFGRRLDEPVILVCTHGRRDVCCARLGRPVAEELSGALHGRVWEASHLGGHRYAANVVSLPDGVYHGGVTRADTRDLADALAARRVLPERLRGRAGLPAAVQAADYFARVRYGVFDVDGVIPLTYEPAGRGGEDGTVRVALRLPDHGECTAHVRPRLVPGNGPASCGDTGRPEPRTTFDLVALTGEVSAARPA